jgi:glycosyltransferase involved in cell wall biosynthesis
MLVSVVLPTFNRGYCLERAIRSVLGQTYPDWELIVVDDGSTDDTQAVLESFKDPRIRVFRHSVNRGVAAARNTGLAAARGEFIAFLDSDDEWRPDKLTKQLDVMTRAPTRQLAFTDLVWRRGDVEAGSFARTLPVFSKLLHQHVPDRRSFGHSATHHVSMPSPRAACEIPNSHDSCADSQQRGQV